MKCSFPLYANASHRFRCMLRPSVAVCSALLQTVMSGVHDAFD